MWRLSRLRTEKQTSAGQAIVENVSEIQNAAGDAARIRRSRLASAPQSGPMLGEVNEYSLFLSQSVPRSPSSFLPPAPMRSRSWTSQPTESAAAQKKKYEIRPPIRFGHQLSR